MSPRRQLLFAVVGGLVVGLVFVGLLAAVRGRSSATPSATASVAQDQPGTVLLVPGYGGGTGGLQALAAKLRARGRTAVVVAAVGDGTGDLRRQAAALKSAADEAIAAGSPSVDVIGYSAGGVIARIWADELDGARVARRIVTLGAPHHGTELAALGAAFSPQNCPKACAQLVSDSSLLRGLESTPDGPLWTSLFTRTDEVVTPPTSARLDGALSIELQSVCTDETVGHGGLPTNALVDGIVERALGVAPLVAAPSPSECSALRAAGA